MFSAAIVTEDGERYVLTPSPAAAALIALTQASSVHLWDPESRRLISANLVGQWLPEDWSAQDRSGVLDTHCRFARASHAAALPNRRYLFDIKVDGQLEQPQR